MSKTASEVIADGDVGEMVDLAINLNRKILDLTKELDLLKVSLREAAQKTQRGSAEVELDGLSGTISVLFPGIALKVKKGRDLKDLEVNIGPLSFAKLFLRTIVIVPAHDADDFLEALSTLTPVEQARVKLFIEFNPMTPKVYVPR